MHTFAGLGQEALSRLGSWLGESWFSNGLATAALLVALATARRSRPRLSVSARTAVAVGATPAGRSIVSVTVINDGGAPARIQRVAIEGITPRFAVWPSDTTVGPELPLDLPAYGGQEHWAFDLTEVLREATWHAHDGPSVARVVVHSGSRRITCGRRLVLAGAGSSRLQPWHIRIADSVRSLAVARPQFSPMFQPPDEADILDGRRRCWVKNHGNGFARNVVVDLVSQDEAGRQQRIEEIPPIRFLWIRPRGRKELYLPLDLPSVEESKSLWWRIVNGRHGYTMAVSASTSADLLRRSERDGGCP